jgi:hypothetical protein
MHSGQSHPQRGDLVAIERRGGGRKLTYMPLLFHGLSLELVDNGDEVE